VQLILLTLPAVLSLSQECEQSLRSYWQPNSYKLCGCIVVIHPLFVQDSRSTSLLRMLISPLSF